MFNGFNAHVHESKSLPITTEQLLKTFQDQLEPINKKLELLFTELSTEFKKHDQQKDSASVNALFLSSGPQLQNIIRPLGEIIDTLGKKNSGEDRQIKEKNQAIQSEMIKQLDAAKLKVENLRELMKQRYQELTKFPINGSPRNSQ